MIRHLIGAGLAFLGLAACGSNGHDTIIVINAGGSTQAGGDGGFASAAGGGSNASGGSSSADGGSSQTGGSGNDSGGSTQAGGDGGSVSAGGTDAGGTSAGGSGGQGSGCHAPVDLILVVDNSGSMEEEILATEQAINTSLAATLDASGIDYQVILISRHRQEDHAATAVAATSICVSPPLSSLVSCPSEDPGPSARFNQYNVKVESFDVLDLILQAYSEPADLAPAGYAPWLRPGALKAFLIITDDDESNDDTNAPLTAETFLSQLTALSPAHFGTAGSPTFAFHGIVGLAEKAAPAAPYLPDEPIQVQLCTGNGAAAESPAPTYQELSIRTGGLRFPICQFPSFGSMFEAVAANAVARTETSCP